MKAKPTIGLLFNGIHGFGIAAEQVGIECAWLSEIDSNCNKLMANHRPDIPNLGDIKHIERVRAVDIVAGGFPCQDVSVAGQRKGLAGERSGLWFEFLRIIKGAKPRLVLIENVDGLLSSNGGRDFAAVLQGLVECGYGVCWRVLDAQYFGLAQRRKRVFIVGSLGDASAVEVLFEREEGQRVFGKKRTARKNSSARFESDSGTNGDGTIVFKHSNMMTRRQANPSSAGLVPTLHTPSGGGSVPLVFNVGNLMRGANADPIEELVPTLRAYEGDSAPLVSWNAMQMSSKENRSRLVEEATPALDTQGQVYLSLAPTLSAKNEVASSSTQRDKWYEQFARLFGRPRRLTPLEYERLMGFPDHWTAGFPDTVRYKMCGNAVAVPNIVWILNRAKHIL